VRAAERVSGVLRQMSEIFTTRDPLLRTQGPLVQYYWLVRALPQAEHPFARAFLVAFEAARQANRLLARDADTADEVDTELSRYDHLNRSINDAGSIEGRYEILMRRFQEYRHGAAPPE
jgi:hypothetical protein